MDQEKIESVIDDACEKETEHLNWLKEMEAKITLHFVVEMQKGKVSRRYDGFPYLACFVRWPLNCFFSLYLFSYIFYEYSYQFPCC